MPVLEAPLAPVLGAQEERIVDAALRCFGRWGVAKTTLDDVAREAGYSRATVYRFFPGGKEGLLEGVVRTELARFFTVVGARLDAAADLEDLIVGGMTTAATLLTEHRPLQYLLANEPEVVLPRISFHEADHVLRAVSGFVAPYLTRFLSPEIDALRAAEWLSRIVLSYVCSPSPAVDMRSEDSVRSLVQAFVLPGLASI
jgi:AcrR family transcriptional regulator